MTDTQKRTGYVLDGQPLPRALHEYRDELYQALAVPLPAEWPEGEELRLAEQPAAVGKVLVRALHDDVEGARISYLFQEAMGSGERADLGKAKRASGPLAFLTEYAFVLTFNWSWWKLLNSLQRVALVDHELSHCGRDDDGKWILLHHDIEEFSGVVGRWGLWTAGLQTFGRAIKHQLDLFQEGT